MGRLQRGNRTLIKAMNRSLVLNTIRREGPLSRTQLAALSGLSMGSVSQFTNDLLAKNWIREVGEGDYTGGRRQVLLRLNADAGVVVGLKLMEDRTVAAITDLEGQVLHYGERSLTALHDPAAMSADLADVVARLIADSGIARSRFLGVGIGLAGAINSDQGVVNSSPFFGWRNVPLARLIAERVGLPVFLDNDVNTLTFAELLFGPGQHVDDFIVVTMGRGIGMGIVLGGEVYQGTRGGVGEIGHITIDPHGPRCDCGKRGCLEALAADPAVVAFVRAAMAPGGDGDPPQTLADVVRAAAAGHSVARDALARSGAYVGLGIASAVNLLAPSLIIISGEGVIAGDDRIQPMLKALRQHTFNGLLEGVDVVVQSTDDRAWARGAASLVIGKVFESPRLDSRALEAVG